MKPANELSLSYSISRMHKGATIAVIGEDVRILKLISVRPLEINGTKITNIIIDDEDNPNQT